MKPVIKRSLTVRIPPELYVQVRVRIAEQDRTFQSVITELLQGYVAKPTRNGKR